MRCRAREGSTSDPSPPPLALAKAFSRSGCGGIFPLFSGVMLERLSTGFGAKRTESILQGPIFSGPVDCVISVFRLQDLENRRFCAEPAGKLGAGGGSRCWNRNRTGTSTQSPRLTEAEGTSTSRCASRPIGTLSINQLRDRTSGPQPAPERRGRRRPPGPVGSHTSAGCVSPAPAAERGRCRDVPSRC